MEQARIKAAKRCLQENCPMAICERSQTLKIWPVRNVPDGWMVIDVLTQDSPDIGFLVNRERVYA